MRRIGYTDLTFSLSKAAAAEHGGIARLLDRGLCSVQRAKRTVKSMGGGRSGEERSKFKCWSAEGEPSSVGHHVITVKSLAEAVLAGNLLAEDDHAMPWLEAVQSLQTPTKDFYSAPCLRVLCFAPGHRRFPRENPSVAATRAHQQQHPASHAAPLPTRLTLRLHVYVGRLLFYLIAYDPLSTIMRHITQPAGGEASVRRLHPLPPVVKTFKSTVSRTMQADRNAAFTVAGLYKRHESEGCPEAVPPEGLKLRLMDYQRQGLYRLQFNESLEHGLNSLFWEAWDWGDANGASASARREPCSFWYSPELGELRLEEPAVVRGGILADEMGLGKTLQCTALILADKQRGYGGVQWREGVGGGGSGIRSSAGGGGKTKKAKTSSGGAGEMGEAGSYTAGGRVRSAATLVICPRTLVRQWQEEIKKGTNDLSVKTYTVEDVIHGRCCRVCAHACPKTCPHRDCNSLGNDKCIGPSAHARERIWQLSQSADVVVTTYAVLNQASSKRGEEALMRIHWRRAILDEMQMVCSSTTALAQNCRNLGADFRLMVSGTPLYNTRDGPKDLNGELAFLRVLPFDQDVSVVHMHPCPRLNSTHMHA